MFRQNALEPYPQRFADERRLAAAHHRFRTWMLGYIGVCALLAGSLCAYLSWQGLQRNLAGQRNCEGRDYPWHWRSDDSPPFASFEECVAARPLLRGEARDFAALAALPLTLGLLLVTLGLGLRHRLPPSLRVLRDAPGSVVWAYGFVYVGQNTGRVLDRVACVCTRDGVTHTLRIADAATLDSVLARIASHCPQAVLGHTPALAAAFAANPGTTPPARRPRGGRRSPCAAAEPGPRPQSMFATIRAQVLGPTRPSTSSPAFCWNATTASWVPRPKMPSTVSQ
jgi:hypothetical protein